MNTMQTPTRTAVVTGGAQGIGLEISCKLLDAGHRVALFDINEASATAAAKVLAATGKVCKAYEVDVSNHDMVASAFAQVARDLGKVEILVNNAAVFSTLSRKPMDEISASEWETVLRVNVSGAFFAAKAASIQMREAGWGRIISISSNTVGLARPYFLHYVTSKSALIGMTRSMARELGAYGITVNALMPSLTRTNVATQVVQQSHFDEIEAMQCIKRSGSPEDVAGAIDFLVSEQAGFITGQTIAVDGGAVFL